MQAHTTAFTRLHDVLAGKLFVCQPGAGTGGGEDAVALKGRAKAGHDFLRRCAAGDRSGHDGWFPPARRASARMRLANRSGCSLVVRRPPGRSWMRACAGSRRSRAARICRGSNGPRMLQASVRGEQPSHLLPRAGGLEAFHDGEVATADQQVRGVSTAEPPLHLLVNDSLVADGGFPARASEQSDRFHGCPSASWQHQQGRGPGGAGRPVDAIGPPGRAFVVLMSSFQAAGPISALAISA